MWLWLLQPKNLLIAILIAGCIVLAGLGLWYRAASAVSASRLEKAQVEQKELRAIVEEYQKDMVLIKAHSARLQKISSDGSAARDAIVKLQRRELTNEEAVVAADIGKRFGVLKTSSGKVLPKPGEARVD